MDSRLFVYNGLNNNQKVSLPFGQLLQVSELSVVPGGEIAEHMQRCDEITYVVSGKAIMYSGDKQEFVSDGEIHYIKQGVKHKIVADMETKFRYICIGFIPDRECQDIACFNRIRDSLSCSEVIRDDGNVRILTEMLINEVYNTDNEQRVMVNSYMCQILISFYRLFYGKEQRLRENEGSATFTFYHALRYIDREFMNITSVKGIAEALCYSEYYLSHLFKEKIGISIKEYIARKKCESAAELLLSAESNMSIGEIAERFGFSTSHAFSLSFKKYYGVSPAIFRKQTDKN